MANFKVGLVIQTIASLAGLKAATKATAELSKVTGAAVNPAKALNQTIDYSKRVTKAEADAITEDLKAKRLGVRATEDLGQATERTGKRVVSFAARLRLARMRTTEFRAGLGRGLMSSMWAAGGAVTALGSGAVLLTSWLGRTTLAQAKVAKETRNAAQSAGITTREYQRLNYAFETSGVGGQKLGDSLKFLNQNVIRAARGGKDQQVAFKALGVTYMKSARQLVPTDELLGRVAERFAKMPDGAKKTAIATMIFGDAGEDLIPVLNKGRAGLKDLGDEAERFGLVLSDEAIKKAAALDLQWLRTTKMIKGLRDALVTALLPAFSDLVGWLEGILARDRQKILGQINAGVAALKANLPAILKGLSDLWSTLALVAAVGGAVIKFCGGLQGALEALGVIVAGRFAFALIQVTALMWGVNGALWAFPGTWIIGGIVALGVAAFLLIRHWGAVKAFFGGLFAKLKAWFTGLPVWAQLLISLPGTVIAHWSEITGFFRNLFAGLKHVFVDGTVQIWNSLPPWMKGALTVGAFAVNPALGAGALALGAARPSGPAAPTAAVGGRANRLDGTLRVAIDQDGRARATSAQTNQPGVDFDLSRGFALPAF